VAHSIPVCTSFFLVSIYLQYEREKANPENKRGPFPVQLDSALKARSVKSSRVVLDIQYAPELPRRQGGGNVKITSKSPITPKITSTSTISLTRPARSARSARLARPAQSPQSPQSPQPAGSAGSAEPAQLAPTQPSLSAPLPRQSASFRPLCVSIWYSQAW